MVDLTTDDGTSVFTPEQASEIGDYDPQTQYYLAYMATQSEFPKKDKTQKSMILNSKIFDSARYQQYLDNQFFKQKIESVKGIFGTCKCGNDEVVFYEKQTRSSDEPMTYFITCTACKRAWTR